MVRVDGKPVMFLNMNIGKVQWVDIGLMKLVLNVVAKVG
jgi:hypothetical protein